MIIRQLTEHQQGNNYLEGVISANFKLSGTVPVSKDSFKNFCKTSAVPSGPVASISNFVVIHKEGGNP